MPEPVKARALQDEREEQAECKPAHSHHCDDYLGHPFLNNDTKQENSNAR